jgi:hypothetical protein
VISHASIIGGKEKNKIKLTSFKKKYEKRRNKRIKSRRMFLV